MPLRFTDVPSLGRRLTNLMAAPSSAEPETHKAGLDAYRRLGGNCIHLHGEGGETHSRRAVGDWLHRHGLRPQFFLCTQICHDAWNEANHTAVSRFHPDAVHEDIAVDLQLIGIDALDLVYLDDSRDEPFEPIVDAMGQAISEGTIGSYGVRNWTAARIRGANAYAASTGQPGISAIVTTELSLLHATSPLWPEYLPVDAEMRRVMLELGLAVFAHVNDMTTGQAIFDDGETQSVSRPRWMQRWQDPANQEVVSRVRQLAASRGVTTRELNIGYLLTEPFPVIGIFSLPLLTTRLTDFQRASNLALSEAERSFLRGESGV